MSLTSLQTPTELFLSPLPTPLRSPFLFSLLILGACFFSTVHDLARSHSLLCACHTHFSSHPCMFIVSLRLFPRYLLFHCHLRPGTFPCSQLSHALVAYFFPPYHYRFHSLFPLLNCYSRFSSDVHILVCYPFSLHVLCRCKRTLVHCKRL